MYIMLGRCGHNQSSKIDPSFGIVYLLVLSLGDKIELPIHYQQRPPCIYPNENIILLFRKIQRETM